MKYYVSSNTKALEKKNCESTKKIEKWKRNEEEEKKTVWVKKKICEIPNEMTTRNENLLQKICIFNGTNRFAKQRPEQKSVDRDLKKVHNTF